MRPKEIKDNQTAAEEIPENLVFWSEIWKGKGERKHFEGIKINLVKLCRCLMDMGFFRFDLDIKTLTYVQIQEKIVAETNRNRIIDKFIDHVRSFEKYDLGNVEVEEIITAIYNSFAYCFKEDVLNRMVNPKPINFVSDTESTMYFPFKNGLAEVTKDGLKLVPYSKVELHIWEKQIIPFDFKPSFGKLKEGDEYETEKKGMFAKFAFNIAGKDTERFLSLCTIIGYNLHYYFDAKLKATIFTDSEISENPEGRTGKTLLGKAIQKVRNCTEINGKDFDSDDRFRWQEVEISTQIVILNDLRRGFFLENLFNDITEGIAVQYKGNRSFKHQAKIIINTNQTIKIEGGSSRDRVIEYELSNHYSQIYSPADEFGCWFFRDWNADEWNNFYNYMLFCSFSYLKYGVRKPENINIGKRALLDHTCSEFVSFCELEAKGWLESNEELCLQDLFAAFKNHYPDAKDYNKFVTKGFSKWVNTYAQSVGKKVGERRRSNSKDYFKLI